MADENKVLLKLSDVSLITQQRKRLDRINISIKQGEVVALVGRSGAGKSSLFSTLLGLFEGQLSGDIEWQGQPLSVKQLVALRGRAIRLVPQGLTDALSPQSRVLDVVLETLRLHTTSAPQEQLAKARRALQQGGVAECLFDRYPRHLSGGEVQRVLMVLATLDAPQLLLLDEPSAALDAFNKAQLTQRLRALKGRSSMLLISHDLPWLRTLADRVLVLEQGRIIEDQACDAFFTAPQHAQSRALIEAQQKVTLAPEPIDGQPLLNIRDLSYSFAAEPLFTGLNWQIKQGERWLLEGPSGVGKSTLARIIAGWLPVQKGRLEWLDDTAVRCQAQRVSLIPQHAYASFSTHLNVGQILSEPLRLSGVVETSEQLRQRLASVRLPDTHAFLTRLPHTLSGGEQQRLALARALTLMPKLLVADEPTSALDPLSKQVFLDVLLTLQAQYQFALLVVSHDQQMLQDLQAQPMTLPKLRSAVPLRTQAMLPES